MREAQEKERMLFELTEAAKFLKAGTTATAYGMTVVATGEYYVPERGDVEDDDSKGAEGVVSGGRLSTRHQTTSGRVG